MRVAKWTLIIAGSLLLLLAATVLVITSVIDPNRYRGRIEAIVAERVGRSLVIDGNLEIMWFPWLGVRTGASHLANRPGDTGPPIVEWESIGVAAKVLPLLKGQLVVDRIRLQSPRVRLWRDVRGHGNWEDLTLGATGSALGAEAEPGAAPGGASGAASELAPGRTSGSVSEPRGASGSVPGARARSKAAGGGTTPPVQIAGVEIRDGTLAYVDEASGLQVNLSKLDYDMGEWRAGQSLPVHARFLVNGGSLPAKGVWVQVDTPALEVRRGAAVQAPTPQLAGLNAQAPTAQLAGSNAQTLAVIAPQLTIKVADAELRGDLNYQQGADGAASAHGAIAGHTASLRKLAGDLGLNQTMPHDPTTLGALELTANWSYDKGLIAARSLAIKLDGVTLEGWVEHSAAPESGWRFQLHGDRIDLGRYVNVDSNQNKPFEIEMLRAINANGSLIFDEAQLADTHMSDVRLRFETPEAR